MAERRSWVPVLAPAAVLLGLPGPLQDSEAVRLPEQEQAAMGFVLALARHSQPLRGPFWPLPPWLLRHLPALLRLQLPRQLGALGKKREVASEEAENKLKARHAGQ